METFLGREQLGTEETRAIRHMFGPFPATAAEACLASVMCLVTSAGEAQTEAFVKTQNAGRSGSGRASGSIFGRNIAFSHEGYMLECHEPPPWLDSPDEDAVGLGFQGFLNNHVGRGQAAGSSGIQAGSGGRGSAAGDAGANILREEVDKYQNAGNMISSSPEELCTSLFEMLASQKTDEELQNEVSSITVHHSTTATAAIAACSITVQQSNS